MGKAVRISSRLLGPVASRLKLDRRLAACVGRRDEISIAHASLCANLASTTSALTATEIENIQSTNRNAELAQKLFKLVEAKKARADAPIEDPMVRSEMEELKEELRGSRLKWRIIKSVVSAMVAGSGVDWARDDRLRKLVMDDEEDEIEELS